MRATRSINAFVGKHEALHRSAVHYVGFDDLFNVGGRDASVPDAFRINDHRWTVFALVETSRHIGPHSLLESTQGKLLLEKELELGLSGWIAAPAWMSGLTLIAADKQVPFELRHSSNLQDFLRRDRG